MSVVKRRRFLFGGAGLAVLSITLAVAALVALDAMPGSAQVVSTTTTSVSQYSSKFLCGTIPSPADPLKVLAPGVYNTAVNIHNPNAFDVVIQKKAVISVPESQNPGQGFPGQRATHVLSPDASMEVDCAEIFNLLANANPSCSPQPGTTNVFCKGFLVVEAARAQTIAGQVKYFPAQLDVTDIITVKEEDGIWKDYTFSVRCLSSPCAPLVNYRFDSPYNLPVRPTIPNCYYGGLVDCAVYDVEQTIKQRIDADCGFCGLIYQPVYQVVLIDAAFATDSRDVALDHEIVSPTRVTYPCWPKGGAACP